VKGHRVRDPWAVARANALARGAKPALASGAPPSREPAGRTPSKTEIRYAAEVLDPARTAGDILDYTHQPSRPFPLAHRCDFFVDYIVRCADGVTEIVDVKREGGWLHEDATLKMKFLARLRPDLRCVQAFRRSDGTWRRRVIPPFVPPSDNGPA
jgi:hypothetical protein